ncbi:complement C4-like isoform X1 [Micropterus dolomieu]|uniref:complement C4-like isoform X1 n=1 Tax=Micropterus dolomieu TaxID=147949 RepID=UPI001E8E01D5|nr:complement C4-like isoform X1 [Micropterus dolomieu]
MMTLKSNFYNEKLQDFCIQGFYLNPMRRTCQERAKRVSLVEENPVCAEAFLKCCLEGERLRQKKIQEDSLKGLGRTASTADIEEFFLDTVSQNIRRFFPPSFAFTEFDVNDKGSYSMVLPHSITTWEIQVITLSAATGFCVVKPPEVKASKRAFVSLQLWL